MNPDPEQVFIENVKSAFETHTPGMQMSEVAGTVAHFVHRLLCPAAPMLTTTKAGSALYSALCRACTEGEKAGVKTIIMLGHMTLIQASANEQMIAAFLQQQAALSLLEVPYGSSVD